MPAAWAPTMRWAASLPARSPVIGPPRHSTPKLTTENDPVEVFFLPDPLEEVIDNNLPITTARPYLLQQQISPRIDLRGNVGKAQLHADQIRLVGRQHP